MGISPDAPITPAPQPGCHQRTPREDVIEAIRCVETGEKTGNVVLTAVKYW
jgi:hypothetical protein